MHLNTMSPGLTEERTTTCLTLTGTGRGEPRKKREQRIKIYNTWMPHVHVDFHEQRYRNPYYFAPAAEPFHEVITPWQRNFQTQIGKNNAKYFDEQGWLYFTKEVFDLYYPSYGDTYPTYSGSIGMTYEQAGGGYAGLTITTPEDDPLTLRDRLIHHHTTGLSTVEITSKSATTVVDEFAKYFQENINNPICLLIKHLLSKAITMLTSSTRLRHGLISMASSMGMHLQENQ